MRTWVKVTLGGALLFVLFILALGGTAAYFVFGNLETRPATETEALPVAERTGTQPRVEFDVTVVGGEAGRRLAVLQAAVILDVLTWLHEHQYEHRSGPPSG